VEQGLELSSLSWLGAEVAAADTLGWERVFLDAMTTARVPWGARVRGWREVEHRLPQALDEVLLAGRPLGEALTAAARDIDRILAETER
jgi:hypothetical protein